MHLFKTRVKYRFKGTDIIKIGYLIKDKLFTGGYKVQAIDKSESTSVQYLDLLEKI